MDWVTFRRRPPTTVRSGSNLTLDHLLRRIDTVTDARAMLQSLTAAAGPRVVAFVNANTVTVSARDHRALQAVCAADYVVRDGIGVAVAARLRGHQPGLNMNGTDLIPTFLKACERRRVALYGTREPWLSNAIQAVSSTGHDVVDAWHGFEDDPATYAERILRVRPEIIILGMGQPKQELVAERLRTHLRPADVRCVIFCGGAILDFLGGRFPRAPQWLRRARLEWLFRLSREPRRLWRRYTIDTAAFLLHAILIRPSRDADRRLAATCCSAGSSASLSTTQSET